MGATRAIAGALICCAVAMTVAASAHAGGELIDTGIGDLAADPVFADDRLAWAAYAGEGDLDVHLAEPGGPPRTVRVPLPAAAKAGGQTTEAWLGASAQRWALHVLVRYCGDEYTCRYGHYETLYSAILSAPLGEPFEFITGCTDTEACRPCRRTNLDDPRANTLDVADNAVAYEEPCRSDVVTVRDFAADAPPPLSFEEVETARLGGPFLALNYDYDRLVVHDVRSGSERYRVDLPGFSNFDYDVQADGTVAWTRVSVHHRDRLVWASADQPFLHDTGLTGSFGQVRIADGRIAFSGFTGRDVGANVGVVGIDGAQIATAALTAYSGIAFNGERLAYVQHPCPVGTIGVWDLAGSVPQAPADECPAATLTSRSLTVDLPSRRLDVPLACPSRPPLGCHGNAIVYARRPGARAATQVARNFFTLAPSVETRFAVPISRRRLCSIARGSSSIRAKLEVEAFTRGGEDSRSVRRSVRIRGLQAC